MVCFLFFTHILRAEKKTKLLSWWVVGVAQRVLMIASGRIRLINDNLLLVRSYASLRAPSFDRCGNECYVHILEKLTSTIGIANSLKSPWRHNVILFVCYIFSCFVCAWQTNAITTRTHLESENFWRKKLDCWRSNEGKKNGIAEKKYFCDILWHRIASHGMPWNGWAGVVWLW